MRGAAERAAATSSVHSALAVATFGLWGVGLGVVTAVLLRRHRMAADWGLLGLGPVGLVALLGVSGLVAPMVTACGVAFFGGVIGGCLGYGMHREQEERRAGGDKDVAREHRRGIFDGLRRRVRERSAQHEVTIRDGVPVGRTHRGELAVVARGDARSGCHVLIPGATGAGKTTSLAALLVEYVVRSGFGSVVLEAKIDGVLCAAAEAAAARRGVPFRMISASGSSGYDPLAQGSIDERSERLVSAQTWGSDDADFYRQAASPFLRLVLRVLEASGEKATLASVARGCDPDGLENAALGLEDRPELVRQVSTAVAALRSDEKRAIAGLHARLKNLATSDFAQSWLDPEREGVHSVDLREAIDSKEIVYFRFDTDRTGNVGRAIAQMVLLDLGAAASARMGAGVGTFVAIDEFGALEAPALERLYARGRAAGFSVAVGTQTLADLRAAGPAVRERIGSTVSAVVCHRIGGQADAEWMAQLIGAVPTWQSTIRTNRWGVAGDEGTRTRGYRFEVNPSELQRLDAGEAYVARLDTVGRKRAWRARVVPPWQRMEAMTAG